MLLQFSDKAKVNVHFASNSLFFKVYDGIIHIVVNNDRRQDFKSNTKEYMNMEKQMCLVCSGNSACKKKTIRKRTKKTHCGSTSRTAALPAPEFKS